MSQLFNIVFPRFWFDVQKEYEFEFNDPNNLPFTVTEDHKSIFVESLKHPDPLEKPQTTIKMQTIPEMLIPGLHIIAINGKDITNKPFTRSKFYKVMQRKSRRVKISFREDIEADDPSLHQPLGLGYTKSQSIHNHDEEEDDEQKSVYVMDRFGRHESIHSHHKFDKIQDDALTASSFKESFEAWHARLNNPNSCWKPESKNLSSFIWLKIDLQSTKQIARILIQGNQDHSNYLTAAWIDFSRDGCVWKSYFQRETPLVYNNKNVAEIKFWPVMVTRFIRLRPHKWFKYIAVRMELYGLHTLRTDANIHNARVVNFHDVDADYKKKLLEKTKNLPRDTSVIQVNCQKVIANALDRAGITEVSWLKCLTGNVSMCAFSTRSVQESERALDRLTDIGVGKEMGIINVMPVHYRNDSNEDSNVLDMKKYMNEDKGSFAKSIKNRKLVQEMVDRVMESAILTFDYCMNLFAASCIAVGGLATGNSVVIVASMLVSPIMGPVMAVTFGFTINEPVMIWIGIKNEAISLCICIIIGFIFGMLYAVIS